MTDIAQTDRGQKQLSNDKNTNGEEDDGANYAERSKRLLGGQIRGELVVSLELIGERARAPTWWPMTR